MFTYDQSTGYLYDPDEKPVGRGYSGHGPGLNNPAMQAVHDVGPVPQGYYSVGPPRDSEHGPFTLDLSPFQENSMFERANFHMHGDRVDAPGQHLASRGCIIQNRDVREMVWNSSDHVIHVIGKFDDTSGSPQASTAV